MYRENYRYEIYGKVSKDFKRCFYRKKNITFHGEVSRNQIKKIFKKVRNIYLFHLKCIQLAQIL